MSRLQFSRQSALLLKKCWLQMKRNHHLRNMQISFHLFTKTILRVRQSQLASVYPVSSVYLLSWSNHNSANPLLTQSPVAVKSVKVYFGSKQFDFPPPLHHLDPKRLVVFISFKSSCNASSPSQTLITTSVQAPGRSLLQGGSASLAGLLPTMLLLSSAPRSSFYLQ